MRCKQCDYRLWGVQGRECPECGTPFRPSDFEFVPNSVRFCCPHCGQDYYGTGPYGHLQPFAFDCARCRRRITMDQMTLFTTEGVREEQTIVEVMPWLERSRVGFLRGWWQTLKMGMVSPTRLMELTPADSSVVSAWWFAVLVAAVGTLGGMLPFVVLISISGGFWAAPAMVFMGLLSSTVLIVVWGVFTHLVLSVTGRPAFGLRRTWQAICYASAPNIIASVPCLGIYLWFVGWIWWVVSAVLMIRAGQRTSGLRAGVAVLSFPVLAIVGSIFLVAYVVVPQMGAARQAAARAATQAAPVPTYYDDTARLTRALAAHAEQNAGQPPAHAAELLATGIPATVFVHGNWQTAPAKVPVAGTTLERLGQMQPSGQLRMAEKAAKDLPPDVVAHRLGSFVFAYHGIDFESDSPALWVVVFAPHPSEGIKSPRIFAGAVDGNIAVMAQEEFAEKLANQNQLRETYGLPPLPDPHTVTHAQPATGIRP